MAPNVFEPLKFYCICGIVRAIEVLLYMRDYLCSSLAVMAQFSIALHIIFFQQIGELKKENFDLKLRIYFLEERLQQKFGDEDVFKTVS